MTATARKALSSVVQFLSVDAWAATLKRESPKKEEVYRVGEYYADYSIPTEEQLAVPQAVDELFKNSKPVSR